MWLQRELRHVAAASDVRKLSTAKSQTRTTKGGVPLRPPFCFLEEPMRARSVMVILAMAMAMLGCNRERASITGAYGEAVLMGQVVMAGMENPSPAGVRVSVQGTGMTMILAEDGRFTFAGVPRNAVLHFSREDGIDASLAVTATSRALTVEVSKAGAKEDKSNRGQSGRQKKYEFEGLVRSASATELVVFTSHREEVTIGLDADTVIRKGNQIIASGADITVDTRVHVRARKVDDAYVANLVIVQNPADDPDDGEDARPAVKEYEGTIVSASETELVVFTSHKEEVTFVLNGDTVIRKGNTPVAAADLLAGWRVHVKATTEGDTKTATLVIVQKNK